MELINATLRCSVFLCCSATKKYVLNAIKIFITNNNINFDEEKLSDIIEKVIDITKKINVSAGVK